MALPDVLRGSLHRHRRGRGHRPDPADRQHRAERFPGEPDDSHHHDPVGFGHCFGLHRQHPLHRHHASRRALHERKLRSAQGQRPVVGPLPGSLPGRQRHHDRRQRQRRHHGHGGEGRLPHLLRGIHEDLLVAHDHHRHHVYGLFVDSLLRQKEPLKQVKKNRVKE